MGWSDSLLWLVSGWPAAAAPAHPAWTLPVSDDVLVIEVLNQHGEPVLSALQQDGRATQAAGWLPDLDPRRGRLAGHLDGLWLPAGPWEVRARPAGDAEPLWRTTVEGDADWGPVHSLRVGEATAVESRARTGADWSWAPSSDGAAPVPRTPEARDVAAVGPDGVRLARLGPHTTPPDLSSPTPPADRRPHPHAALLWLGLLPVGAAALAWGVASLGRALRRRETRLPLAAAVALGLLVVLPIAGDPGQRLLYAGGPVSDPADSVALLALVAEDLPLADGIGAALSWPEGADWLAAGPAWLAYGLLAPVTLAWNAVAAHNLGVGLGAALLALSVAALARSRGASPGAASVGAAAAVLAPAVWDEWDAVSLDRAALCVAPLFVLALDRAADRSGARGPALLGLALAGALLAQVYYGLYLAVAAPLLALPRLLGSRPLARLRRLGGGAALALVLSLPALWALQTTTTGSGAEAAGHDAAALLDLPGPAEVELALRERAAVVRAGGQDPLDMQRPRDRVISAASRSWAGEDALWPRGLLTGGPWFWLLAGASLLAARRRREAARSAWDVAVLLVFAMGPVLQWGGGWTGVRLPWLAAAAAVPGFDHLKNVYRYGLLAACLAGVPLALLVDGVARRLRRRGLGRATEWAVLTAAGAAALLLWLPRERQAAPRIHLPPPARALVIPALPSGLDGPVVLVPATAPPDAALLLPGLAAGLPLVNASPIDPPALGPTPWSDDQPLLNRLARLSADPLTQRVVPGDLGAAAQDLALQGVSAVVVRPDALLDPALADELARELAPATDSTESLGPWRIFRLPDPAGR